MSLPTVTGATGAPAVNQALEPEWVRRGSAATQQAYASALAFEETLVEQLSQSLASTSGLDGESGEGGSGSEAGGSEGAGASSSPISSMLPQALAAGVMQGGGLGLAAQLTHDLETAGRGTQAPGGGGAAPAAEPGAITPAGGAAATPTATASGGTGA
jgi:Rod binding domain-containing protein